MNPLAKALNEDIIKCNPAVYDMLSNFGKNIYMPKGILSQSAEAKQKANKYNATIGTAVSHGEPMYLDCVYNLFSDNFKPTELFPYAPATGLLELRKKWKEKMLVDNPSLKNKFFSLPLVTNALTHGISLVNDMFVDEGDYVVLPDKFWGNYRLTFTVRGKGQIATYEIFDQKGGFNVNGMLEKVKECGKLKGKVIVVLNFPNNPTGYTPLKNEMEGIAQGLVQIAESGIKVVVVADDAYFGLFFDDACFKESVFTMLTCKSRNLLAIKLDGATKENFVWGFRVGFITFGATVNDETDDKMLAALDVKIAGAIRSSISNGPMPSQSAILKAISNPDFYKERKACNAIIEERCKEIKKIFEKNEYADEFTPYPFNSGYFMCIKLKNANSEALRVHLLNNYSVGVISTEPTDIRVAFSSVEKEDIEELFRLIYKGCKDKF